MKKNVKVDVMIDGRYYTTVRTTVDTVPRFTYDSIVDVFDCNELERDIYNRLPSLKKKKNVEFKF